MYMDWCTNIAPNIWIGIVNLADARVHYSVYTAKDTRVANPGAVALEQITWFAPPGWSGMTMNGFTWDGDSGINEGTGYDDGYFYTSRTKYGNNRFGGGVGAGTSSGNKLVLGNRGTGNLGMAWYELSAVDAVYQDYNYYVISSSTSIIKYGVCSTDALVNRWSALGVNIYHPNGPRMVMASSTSDGTTDAATLCAIFQALGMVDGLRLDGGPSAILSPNGYPVNPLTGLNCLKHGSYRHISSVIRIQSHFGACQPRTAGKSCGFGIQCEIRQGWPQAVLDRSIPPHRAPSCARSYRGPWFTSPYGRDRRSPASCGWRTRAGSGSGMPGGAAGLPSCRAPRRSG